MSYVGSHFSSIDPIHKPHNRNFCCCLLSCSIRHSLAIFVESSIRRIENFYNNHSAKTSLISLLQTLNVNKKQHTFGICFLFFGFFSIFVGFRKKNPASQPQQGSTYNYQSFSIGRTTHQTERHLFK